MKIINKKLIKYDKSIPVYDLTVEDDSHNFQLGNGVFVHNCSNFTGIYYAKYSKLELQDIELSTEFVKSKFKEYGLDVKSKKRSDSAERKEYSRWYYKVEFHTGLKVNEDLVLLDNEDVAKQFPKLLEILPSTFTNYIPDPTIWRSTRCNVPMNTKYLKYVRKEEGHDVHFYINDIENEDIATSYEFNTKVHIDNPEKGTKNDSMDWYISIGVSEVLDDNVRDFCVNNLSVQQGVHERIFNNAWKEAFESVFGAVIDNNSRDHSWMGLNVLCILKCTEVDFASQTKERLTDIPGFSVYQKYPQLVRALQKIIKDNYEIFSQNYQRIAEYLKSKDNWSRLSQIKSMIQVAADQGGKVGSSAFKPRKLKDCTCKDRSKAELFVCFTGDTEILDCNNKRISFKNLANRIANGEEIYTLSCDENGVKYPSKIIWAGITGSRSEMLKITLDNGEVFECTPDHKMMMRDGTYKEAKDLKVLDSLMPIYMQYLFDDKSYGGCKRLAVKGPKGSYDFRDCYEGIDSNNQTLYYMYRIMGMHKDVLMHESAYTDNIVHLHHIDNNSENDYPNNLLRVGNAWHRSHHGGLGLLKHYNNGEFNRFYGMDDEKRKSLSISSKNYWDSASEDTYDKYTDMGVYYRDKQNRDYCINMINILKSNNMPLTFSEFDSLGKKLYPTKHFYASNLYEKYYDVMFELVNDYFEKDREMILEILDNLVKSKLEVNHKNFKTIAKSLGYFLGKGCGLRPNQYADYRNYFIKEFSEAEVICNNNHKVQSIEFITYETPIDTYCLRVDNDLHNFPLAAGVFTHNCEGNSASGSLTKARAGMDNIAILPLRGRPLNVSGRDITEVLENDEMYDLINAIGVGVNDYHNTSQIRYGKIIINADSDADGFAIANLVLGCILTHMTFLIEQGMVYIARCPLYGQEGNKFYYYGEEDKIDFSKPTKRWKGLGEFNPDELKACSLNPKTRSLIKVTMGNIEYCKALLSSTVTRHDLMVKSNIVTDSTLKPKEVEDVR